MPDTSQLSEDGGTDYSQDASTEPDETEEEEENNLEAQQKTSRRTIQSSITSRQELTTTPGYQ
jgi:hypothetical protein